MATVGGAGLQFCSERTVMHETLIIKLKYMQALRVKHTKPLCTCSGLENNMHVCSAGVLEGTTCVWTSILTHKFTITQLSVVAVTPANQACAC